MDTSLYSRFTGRAEFYAALYTMLNQLQHFDDTHRMALDTSNLTDAAPAQPDLHHNFFSPHPQTSESTSGGNATIQKLSLIDQDFKHWPLHEARFCHALEQFLRQHSYRQLELIVHDAQHLETCAPRFLSLIKNFSHAIQCKITPSEHKQLTDSYLLTDQGHLVRLIQPLYYRGEIFSGDKLSTEVWLSRYTQISEVSTPLRLGLPLFG